MKIFLFTIIPNLLFKACPSFRSQYHPADSDITHVDDIASLYEN